MDFLKLLGMATLIGLLSACASPAGESSRRPSGCGQSPGADRQATARPGCEVPGVCQKRRRRPAEGGRLRFLPEGGSGLELARHGVHARRKTGMRRSAPTACRSQPVLDWRSFSGPCCSSPAPPSTGPQVSSSPRWRSSGQQLLTRWLCASSPPTSCRELSRQPGNRHGASGSREGSRWPPGSRPLPWGAWSDTSELWLDFRHQRRPQYYSYPCGTLRSSGPAK